MTQLQYDLILYSIAFINIVGLLLLLKTREFKEFWEDITKKESDD